MEDYDMDVKNEINLFLSKLLLVIAFSSQKANQDTRRPGYKET